MYEYSCSFCMGTCVYMYVHVYVDRWIYIQIAQGTTCVYADQGGQIGFLAMKDGGPIVVHDPCDASLCLLVRILLESCVLRYSMSSTTCRRITPPNIRSHGSPPRQITPAYPRELVSSCLSALLSPPHLGDLILSGCHNPPRPISDSIAS